MLYFKATCSSSAMSLKESPILFKKKMYYYKQLLMPVKKKSAMQRVDKKDSSLQLWFTHSAIFLWSCVLMEGITLMFHF